MVRLQSYFLCFVTIFVTVGAFLVTPFDDSDEIKEHPLPLLLDAPKEGRYNIAVDSKTLENIKCLMESIKNPDTIAKVVANWIELEKTNAAELTVTVIEKERNRTETLIQEKTKENQNLTNALHTLRIENVNLKKYVLLLIVRNRIEELEAKFLDPEKTKGKTRRQKWKIIFEGRIQELKLPEELELLRQRVPKESRAGSIDTVVDLYRKCSSIAVHDVPYQSKWDEEVVRQMLTVAGITPDQRKIQTVETLLTPLAK